MTISLLQWMSQTSRLQAFLMLSCLVFLVESFISPSYQLHRKSVVRTLHVGEQDMFWNRTETTMSSPRMLSPTHTADARESTFSVVPASTSTERSTYFKHTVSHRNLDQWFHILSGMEEERTSHTGWKRKRKNHRPPAPPEIKEPTDYCIL